VARLAQALEAAVRPGEVLDVVADHASPLVNAHSINVSILDEEYQVWRLVLSRRSSPQVRMRFATYPVDAPLPSRDALVTRRPVVIRGIADRDRRWPALAQVAVSEVAWVVLPLICSDRLLGTLGLGWTRPQVFDEAQVAWCQRVADLTAGALSRAELFDQEEQGRTAAEDLAMRLGLLQDLTSRLSEAVDLATVADLVVGAGLRALDADAAAIGLLDGEPTLTALASVGVPADRLPRWSTHDVSGSARVRDLRATLRPILVTSPVDREAGLLGLDGQDDDFQASATLPLVVAGDLVGIVGYAWRHPRTFDSHDLAFLSAIAANAANPATILARLDGYFAAFKDGEMATVALVVLDPGTGELAYACARHLPPLGTNITIGRPQSSTRIRPDQVLLLYSDGLVERRDQDLYESLDTLAERATTLFDHPNLSLGAGFLIKSMDASSKVVDDTALLALRRHG
jgi:GAF domain-containing protein